MIALDEARRDEAIEAAWQAYRERLPGLRASFVAACERWQMVAIVSGSEVIGALFVRDGVIHIGIVPAWRGRWASRRLIRQMLGYGTRTTLLDGEAHCAEFIGRLGFERDGHEFRWRCARRVDWV